MLGTLNFLDEAKRRDATALVRRGVSFSLAMRFEGTGPQLAGRRRINPVHTMLDTGLDAERGTPHGFGGADDIGRDAAAGRHPGGGVGHIFDHGTAYNVTFLLVELRCVGCPTLTPAVP